MRHISAYPRLRPWVWCLLLGVISFACKAEQPSSLETKIAQEAKQLAIGGKDWKNPSPDTEESVRKGGQHFRHHCQICHGFDGQNTGVPFANKMSPPVADLASKKIQDYTDGQLKWIVENGIRFSGMPGWKGILDDDEMWAMVRYIRHLPPKGSLGIPAVFKEEREQHEESEHKHEGGEDEHEHKHEAGEKPHRH